MIYFFIYNSSYIIVRASDGKGILNVCIGKRWFISFPKAMAIVDFRVISCHDVFVTKYKHAVVRFGQFILLLYFFLFGEWLDRCWTNLSPVEVREWVTGVDMWAGVVPAWQTFKTKPSGYSQALVHRVQTRR